MINENRLLHMFLDLAKESSPSLQEKAVSDRIKGILKSAGIGYTEDDAGERYGGQCGNLICHLPSNLQDYDPENTKKVPGIVFSAHMDTVTPCVGKNILVNREKDLICTDGKTVLGGDDLAGVSAILEAFLSVKEMNTPHGDLWGVFTIGEEIGLLGAKHLNLEKNGIWAKHCYVLDSGGEIGVCDVQGPTQNMLKLQFKGKAAHAGLEPEKGINAIVVAAKAIATFPQGRIDEDTTCNVGIISGGKATNIVCDAVTVDAEVRSQFADRMEAVTEEIVAKAQAACETYGGSVEIEVKTEYPNFRVPADAPILREFSKACYQIGVTPSFEKTGGGSDTNIYNGKGLTAVDISVGMDKVHTTAEQLKISDLMKSAALVYELCWY